ncbi:MAG: hypothetical protein ACH253_09795 [Candidatus Thiodiazotropha sp.]
MTSCPISWPFLRSPFWSIFHGRDPKWNPVKYLPLFGYGLFIEVVQAFMPHRVFSTWDLLADILGLLIYPLVLPLLLRIPRLQQLRHGTVK